MSGQAARARAAATLCALLAPLGGEPRAAERDPAATWSLIYENDLLAGTDRYYTSGFQLAWRSAAYDPPRWLAAVADRSRLVLPQGVTRWGLALGHSIFTPSDTDRRNPDPQDRPYAGWLYGAVSVIAYDERSYGSVELQLGVVGPAALGEQAQNNVHDLLNIDRALGWDFQLKDEPGANLILTRQWRENWPLGWQGLSVGLVPNVAASLGNVQTYGAAGLMLRIGDVLDADFGPPRIRPSVAGSAFFQPDGRRGFYLFASVDGRAVAHDIFLDGNTWRDSRSVEREPLVGEASVGLVLVFPTTRLTLAYTARSREFETQGETAQFGSASLSFRF